MSTVGGALGLVALATLALAHHSYTAEFDLEKPVKLTGTLTCLKCTDPHIWLYLKVKYDSGEVTIWRRLLLAC